ncbi:MAG: hypothetical protein VX367_11695 [SAR324 cluster bacterium]|nr:hypothetical protein [SAR324 cluster bacterium]
MEVADDHGAGHVSTHDDGEDAQTTPVDDASPPRGDAGHGTAPTPPSTASAEKASDASQHVIRLIHAMELDQTRRNVEKVRPKNVFIQYDPKRKGQYKQNMRAFDKAFGKKLGITGSEKMTELAGHWFGGEAQKAIAAAEATEDDPNGDVAYASLRMHLDKIYGQDSNSAADALARIKEGGAIAKDSVVAHQEFYMNLLEAKNSAEAVGNMELFNRETTLMEIIHARIPHQAEKFLEDGNDSFQDLLDFVTNRTTILRKIQPTRQQFVSLPRSEQPEMERCPYCHSAHSFARCNRILAMSLPERVDAATRLGLCFHCCVSGHGAKNCPEKRNVVCAFCNKKGHIAIFHGRQALHSNSPSDSPCRALKQPTGVETDGERDAATDAAGRDDVETVFHDGVQRLHLQLDDDASCDLKQGDEEEE